MNPEVAAYLDRAAEDLEEARAIMTIPLPRAAARSAYYAAFHASEALLLARTGRIAKTHGGLRTALAQVLREASDADRTLPGFLARAYKYKELSDYGVGAVASVTAEDAYALIDAAVGFVDRVRILLTVPFGGTSP